MGIRSFVSSILPFGVLQSPCCDNLYIEFEHFPRFERELLGQIKCILSGCDQRYFLLLSVHFHKGDSATVGSD